MNSLTTSRKTTKPIVWEILFWVNYLILLVIGIVLSVYEYNIMSIIVFCVASASCVIRLIESRNKNANHDNHEKRATAEAIRKKTYRRPTTSRRISR